MTTIHAPCIITPRLMQGVQIGTPPAWVSIGTTGYGKHGRTQYGAWIDYPDSYGKMQEYEVTALSGMGDDRAGLADLLAFLGAAAESYEYRLRTGRQGENKDLFPPGVVAWAHRNADEISMLQYDIENPTEEESDNGNR